MVATGVVPKIRQRAHPQRAYLRLLVVAHQRRDLFAVQRFGDVTLSQWCSIGGEPEVFFSVRKARHACPLVRQRKAGNRRPLLATRYGGSDPPLNVRRGVIGVIVVEIGFDVLWVVPVAMIALAVVLPDEFPIRFDQIINGFGNSGAVEPLLACQW